NPKTKFKKMTSTPNSTGMSTSRSLADIREEQAGNLDRLRSKLVEIDPRDLVPLLVARHVLSTADMAAVYSQ
uniref:Uncharacterized protein n=1 Tax=Panagrolaimus sp. JU765 TaxID=591449 RepID=A0AC34R3I9_9BILA